MEQNYIINLTNELINNLHSDISNTMYEDICFNNIPSQLLDISSRRLNFSSFSMFRPINNYLNEDMSYSNTFLVPLYGYYSSYQPSSNNLQNNNNNYNNYNNNNNNNNTLYDLSYSTTSPSNNYPRAITLRDIFRTLYVNYNEEDENNTFLENFINSTFENKDKFKKVISDSELEKLQSQKFNKINETETNTQCPILCYNFEENEEIIKLPCNHNYNCEAIIKWLSQESNTCPVCRHEFDYKEINVDNKRQTTEHNSMNREQEQEQEQEQEHEQEQEEEEQEEIANIYNLFSMEDILMQQILLSSYSSNNN